MKYKNYIKKTKKTETSNGIRLAVHSIFYCLSLILVALSITFFICIKKPALRMASLIAFSVASIVACLNTVILLIGNCIKQKEQLGIIKEGRNLLKEENTNSDSRNKLIAEFEQIGLMVNSISMRSGGELNAMMEQAKKYIHICNTSDNEVEINNACKEIIQLTKEIRCKVEEFNQLHNTVISHTDNIAETIENERNENNLVIEDIGTIVINESHPIKSTWGNANPHSLFKSNKQNNYGTLKNGDPTIVPTKQNSVCMLI